MRFAEHRASPESPWIERLYGRLLRLYPAAVYEGFGADMRELFRDLYRAERRRRGAAGVAVLVLRAFGEIPLRAVQARREPPPESSRAAAWTPRTDRREEVMGSFLQDLKLTLRTLAKSPAFTAVAVLSLALGIGANTAIFSILNAVFLRPLPYPEPDRLVMVAPSLETADGGVEEIEAWSYPYFDALRRHNAVFQDVAAFAGSSLNVTGLDEPDRLRVEYVTASYFPLLGVDARLGRTLLAEETAAEAREAVVVVGHSTWRRRFGGDPAILGRGIRLNGVEHQVVGVLPPGFDGLVGDTELWLPFPMTTRMIEPRRLERRHAFWHQAVARLGPESTLEEARASFPSLAASMVEAVPLHSSWEGAALRLGATRLAEARIDDGIRQPLVLLLVAVALVLAVACANVANLLLARAVARRREIGVRVALGAGRARLIRQFLTESAALAVLGALGGLLVAGLGIQALKSALPRATPDSWTRYSEAVEGAAISIDLPVLVFTLALGLVATLVFGLAPALGTRRTDVSSALSSRGSAPARFGSLRRVSPRTALVVGQMALALVLLVGAGLMIRSLDAMRRSDPGIDTDGVMTALIYLPRDPYQEKAAPFFAALLERLRSLPGVESATTTTSLPLSGDRSSTVMTIRDGNEPEVEKPIGYHMVDTGFLETLAVPLVGGRAFEPTDRRGAPYVALINQTAAERYFGGESPIGRRIWAAMGLAADESAEIVGVVGDVHYGRIEEEVRPDLYLPAQQWPERHVYLLLRTAGDPLGLLPALRREVAALDASLPVHGVATLAETAAGSMSHTRFLALLLGTFAGLAVALAATGVYGVMAYSVSSRKFELGVRVALGARRESILALVLRDGLILAAGGVAVGLAAAAYLTRFLAGHVYRVGTLDGWTLAVTAAGLVAVAAAASLQPARRAGRVDPVTVLRNE